MFGPLRDESAHSVTADHILNGSFYQKISQFLLVGPTAACIAHSTAQLRFYRGKRHFCILMTFFRKISDLIVHVIPVSLISRCTGFVTRYEAVQQVKKQKQPKVGEVSPADKFGSPQWNRFLARDAFVRTNRRAIATMFVCLSVCQSGTCAHCDHTVHFSAGLSLRLDSQCPGHPYTKACPPTPNRLFAVQPGREGRYGRAN